MENEIVALLRGGAATLLNSVDLDIALRETYEQTYGIANYDLPANQGPLGLVRRRPAESYGVGSGLYNFIARFSMYKIHEKFGLSLTEALQLPRHVTDEIFEITSLGNNESVSPDKDPQIRNLAQQLQVLMGAGAKK